MKPALYMLLTGAMLTACGPLTLFYKPGVSVTQMQDDTTRCEVEALRDAPVANQVRQRPPIYFPGQRFCNSMGQCGYTQGYWVQGSVYTVDVNRDLRARVTDMCMARKGYQPVSLPPCSQSVAAAAPAQATTRLPQIEPNSCVIRYDSGNWQIVTPG